ncbi:MAG: FAD:protein FMN transferase [Actinomycetia bacterium]|nr:FAD:protein FMN transferase [Actinomycetes bacterium]
MPAELHEIRFPAMGTTVHITAITCDPTVLDRARASIERYDQRWSRFRAESELSRLNSCAGRPVILARDTFALVAAAIGAWHRTGGHFDPTVHDGLVAAGYDRPFATLDLGKVHGRAELGPTRGCAGIELDPELYSVYIPAGVRLDLGGIAKGFVADLIADRIADRSVGVAVNIGGDVSVRGRGPADGAWVIGIDPYSTGESAALTISLASGAVCTTSSRRRRWRGPTGWRHHLLDPFDGHPANRGLDSVTVIASTATDAETAAKHAFVAGRNLAAAIITGSGLTGLLCDVSGELLAVDGLERFLVPAIPTEAP